MIALFRRIAARAPGVVGSPWTFFGAVAATLAWVITGPIFRWSGGWVLWPATLTSIGAFLLVILLQYTQNRDTRAVQLKLDELIRSFGQARTQLVRLEQLSDEELAEIEAEFQELRAGQEETANKEVAAMAEAKTTTNHDEIQRWVEERGGTPAAVTATGSGDDPGILRIDFGDSEEGLEPISWDEFFEWFDRNELAFVYQEETKEGEQSRFNKLVSR